MHDEVAVVGQEPRQVSLQRRWRLAVLLVLVAVIAWLAILRGVVRREIFHLTGDAQWIWARDPQKHPHPVAVELVRELHLSDRPVRATAKICGDPEYVLRINGALVMTGRNRPEFTLDVVAVDDLLRAGHNVISIEARSASGIGGVLFALDVEASPLGRAAGDPHGRNVIVSGPRWSVRGAQVDSPWVWGRPPDQPWSYPRPVRHAQPLVQSAISEPVRLEPQVSRLGDDGAWECNLPIERAAVLRADLSDAAGAQVTVSSLLGGRVTVEVIALEGQEWWVFPGLVAPGILEWHGSQPPDRIELVEMPASAEDGGRGGLNGELGGGPQR